MQKKNKFEWHYCGLCNGAIDYGGFRLWRKKIKCPECGTEITYRRTITGKLKGVFVPLNVNEDVIEVISWQDKSIMGNTLCSDAETV